MPRPVQGPAQGTFGLMRARYEAIAQRRLAERRQELSALRRQTLEKAREARSTRQAASARGRRIDLLA